MKFSDYCPQFYIKSSRSVNDCRINDCKIGGWVCIFDLVQKKYFVFGQFVLFCISLQCGLNKFDGGTRKSILRVGDKN